MSGLNEGAYYWLVQSYDANDKESMESQKNRFTIIAKGKTTAAINLEVDPFTQHGHVIELTGKTEAGARVMVNGREVPVVGVDGSFPLLHASAAPGTKRHYDHGAELQRRSEYVAEKDRDSVETVREKSRGPGTLV